MSGKKQQAKRKPVTKQDARSKAIESEAAQAFDQLSGMAVGELLTEVGFKREDVTPPPGFEHVAKFSIGSGSTRWVMSLLYEGKIHIMLRRNETTLEDCVKAIQEANAKREADKAAKSEPKKTAELAAVPD